MLPVCDIKISLCDTAVLLKFPHSNCSKRVSHRPLRGRRGRFGTLLQQLECGKFGRTAVVSDIFLKSASQTSQFILARFQARACNTLAFRAVARSAMHRYRARRPAQWPRARMGARAARCRRGGGLGRGKEWRRRHRSGRGPLAWRSAHGRRRHPATQRTCARRAGRPTRRTAGRVGSTAARRGACNSTGRWRQQLRPAAATEAGPQALSRAGHLGASIPGSRCALSPRATRGGGGGQGCRRLPGPVTPLAGQSFSAT